MNNFFIDTAVAHNIFYQIFYYLFIVRRDFKIYFLVFILSRQDMINKNLKYVLRYKKRYKD